MSDQKESRTKKTLLNARINLICYFAALITAFFTRKILLEQLGTEFIGLTGTIGNLLGFLNLAELGIGTAISYVLYKPIADSNRFKINEIVSVLGYLYRWIGFAILGMGIIFSLFLPLVFPDTSFSWLVIYFGFYAYLTAALIGYFANYKATLLSADQRNYVVTGYFQFTTTSKVIIQMVLAIYFRSFILYFAIELILGIINSIILNCKIKQTYPWLRSEIKLGHKLLKKYPEISRYTKQIFAHRVGGVVQGQLTPFLIYSFVSLPMVALYTNYTLLTQKIEALTSSVINSAGAAIGNLVAEGNSSKILKVFKELLSLRFFIATITVACIYEFSSAFIDVWLGSEYVLSNKIVAIVAIFSGLSIARGVLDQFCYACGLFADIWAPYAESAIMVIFAIICGHYWGLPGVLCGPLMSIIIIIYIWKPYYLFSRGFKISVLQYWILFFTHIATSIATYIIVDKIYEISIKDCFRLSKWGNIIVEGTIFTILMFIMLITTYYITSDGFRDFTKRINIRK